MRQAYLALVLTTGCFNEGLGPSSPDDDGSMGGVVGASTGDVPDPAGDGGSDDDNGSGGLDPKGDLDVPAPDRSPVLLSLDASSMSLGPEHPVTIVASVVDPDGEDDIVGGTLEGSNRRLAFGAFTLLRGGTFQLTLSWEDAYAVEMFSFVGSKDLNVTAVFRDRSGAETRGDLSLTLVCDAFEQGAACEDGVCVDLAADDDNCGACGTTCEIQLPGSTLHAGGCSPDGCLPVWDDTCITEADGFTDCEEFCASRGQTCNPGCSGQGARAYFATVNACETLGSFGMQSDCGLDFSFVGFGAYRCCCV